MAPAMSEPSFVPRRVRRISAALVEDIREAVGIRVVAGIQVALTRDDDH